MTQRTSIEAYHWLEETGKLGELQLLVLHVLAHAGRPLGQRECKDRSPHPNLPGITPRFAELTKAGLIIEVGKSACSVTGRKVQKYTINLNPNPNFFIPKQEVHPKLTKAQALDVWHDLHALSTAGTVLRPGTQQLLKNMPHIHSCTKCVR